LKIILSTIEKPEEGYRSRFDHKDEVASPGYYSVYLKDNQVKVELTATQRAAMHRYTFPATLNARIILDIGHQIGSTPSTGLSRVDIVNDHQIEGCKSTVRGNIYFAVEFSKPFEYYGTFDATYKTPESGGSVFPYKNSEIGDKIGAFVTFQTSSKEQILVKIALSYIDVEGARKNLKREMPDFNFDQIRDDADKIWNKELSKIEISGTTEKKMEIFYTSVYHSLLAQYISQDVDGRYFGMDGKVHKAEEYDFYGSFSCWDTYRSQHPFLTLVAPEHVNDFVKSIVAKAKDFGWLPAQHDVKGLIDLFGSNKKFNEKLDQFFTMDPNISPPKYVGVVGTIGQYVHGNQPSHHTSENKYIQSATLNGSNFNRPWITHEEIVKGGSLVFEMGAEPNKKWGNLSPPPSMSK
jgi:predicted alpha-1,2-mannosidase